MTRRGFLGLGAGLAAGTLGLGPLLRPSGRAYGRAVLDTANETLVEPPVRASSAGLLATSLEARVVPHPYADVTAVTSVYEEQYPGPTLRVRPGDRLKVHLSNQLSEITNLHLHGFHVSPSGNSDNVLLHIHPGDTFDYDYAIPADHPSGLYWYHPHFHTLTTVQVSGGMAGAIIVEGDLDRLPGIAGVKERLLLLHATELDPDGQLTTFFDRNQVHYLRTVNGQVNPRFTIRPGETQRLRIGNVSDSTWFRLKLDGHQLHQIAKDGNTFAKLWTQDEILIGPAERIEVLIQGADAGAYALRSLPFDQGLAVNPEVTLATLISMGDPVEPQPLPSTLIPFDDLRNATIDRRREFSFQVLPRDDPQRANFEINSLLFDENRVDVMVPLNATEEWVLTNPSNVFHPFHIHINPFQVTSVNGQPFEAHSYEDTYTIPPRGQVVLRTRFLDFTGKYVFHCHILPHEDNGMMSVVEVVSDRDPLPPAAVDSNTAGLQLLNFAAGPQFTCPIFPSH